MPHEYAMPESAGASAFRCPHLRESGRPLCVATPVVRLPNVLDLREYCLTARSTMCPYNDDDADQNGASCKRPAA